MQQKEQQPARSQFDYIIDHASRNDQMKVVILAGGLGTRISEESHLKPKPMIEIGEMPILWHIMKIYSHFGFDDFIICSGYKQYKIKEFFANYDLYKNDTTFDFTKGGARKVHGSSIEPWKVTVVDTGYDTMTGGRIKRVAKYIDGDFMVTYGDGVSDIDLNALLSFHNKNKKVGTVTAIQPGGRFGTLTINKDNHVSDFSEKRKEDGGWINGGFMVFKPDILDLIDGDDTIFEREPLEKITMCRELVAYKHAGFWQCMDTLRDKILLESLVEKGQAPWIRWTD
jgi:glucose-1-phosphate cytidylyltransferase